MDEIYGIGCFLSNLPGIVGKIKVTPEDFVVEEIPTQIVKEEGGKYLILKVRLREWDTNKFLITLARRLGISRKRITYAGTKDKFAVTTQYFCVNIQDNEELIRIGDAEILESFRTGRMLRLGDLVGNTFSIRITPDDGTTIPAERIMEIYGDVSGKGGFPNFFGPQRFGSIRANTHSIGKLLVAGDYEAAVRKYIYDPDFDAEEYRKNFSIHNDPRESLMEFPAHLTYERSLLGYMAEHGSAENALSSLPRNLSMMFVHAYQSYLFNRILTARIQRSGSSSLPIPGDRIVPIDRYFNPRTEPVRVTRFNVDKISNLVTENKARPIIPLFGYKSAFSEDEAGEIEHRILDGEMVRPADFYIKDYPELSSSGDIRITSFMPENFSIPGENLLNFSLGKGIYATSLTRELLKKF